MPSGVGGPLGTAGQLSWFCPLSAPRAPQRLAGSTGREAEKRNHPWFCAALLSIS